MSQKCVKSKFPGVRYRVIPSDKNGVKFDRYYFIRYKLDGRDKEEGLGRASQGWTEQKAAARLSELKENQRIGQGPKTLKEKRDIAQAKAKLEASEKARAEQGAITFAAIFKGPYFNHLKSHKKPTSVVTENGLFIKWIAPIIGDAPLKDISPFHIERIKRNMADAGRAPRSISYALAVIRQVFNFCRDHDLYAGGNPVSKVKKPSADNRRLRFLTHEEAERLLAALAERSPDTHDQALLSLHCGLRAGEIFKLTWQDIDFGRGVLTLRDTKSGKTRAAIMTGAVKAMFATRKQGESSGIVFRARDGGKIAQGSKTFDRVVAALGLNDSVVDSRQKVVFHSLRHTYASWLVESGVDLYTVKELMGHSMISMTERYAHLAPNTLHHAVKTLEKSLMSSKEERLSSINAIDSQ